jgi:hypothetical protein
LHLADFLNQRGIWQTPLDSVWQLSQYRWKDGEAFFDSLRQREDELLKQRNPK